MWNWAKDYVAWARVVWGGVSRPPAPLTTTERRELQNGTLVLKDGRPFRPHPTGNTELDPVTGREIPKQSEKG